MLTYFIPIGQKISGLGSRSEPGVFGSLEPEPEPLEKTRIFLLSFMVKKTIILLFLYFFAVLPY